MLNLPSILEAAEEMSSTRIFHKENYYQAIEVQDKKWSSNSKNMYLALVHYFLPRICRLNGTWGHSAPLAPLISTTAVQGKTKIQLEIKKHYIEKDKIILHREDK